MSDYKFKGQLSTLADMYLNTGDHEPLLEIEHVYTQAAKAGEYETKAEAFDEIAAIITELKGVHETDESGDYYEDFGHRAKRIVLDYESGDSE